jgi:hypothetical protein
MMLSSNNRKFPAKREDATVTTPSPTTRSDDLGPDRGPAWREHLPSVALAAVPILALLLLGPATIDPVLAFGAACLLGARTGSMSLTAVIGLVALMAWVGPLLIS